jgi:hypothetical protein
VTAAVKWGLVVVIAALVGAFVATGVSLVPPSLLLGPCLRDWTSPVSYRPRASPLATVDARVGRTAVRLCYGRPSTRARKVFGGLVPFDSLWRMGANEPTRLSTSGPVTVAGLALPAGRYSLYAIPGVDHWEIFVSQSTQHWGNDISAAVRAREVGHVTVPVEQLTAPVETLTISVDSSRATPALQVDWETTRISLPLTGAP